jgi:hypothetical protein
MHTYYAFVACPCLLIKITTTRGTAEYETLLDSGATVNFIDERLSTKECAHVCSVPIMRVMFHVVAMYRSWAGLNAPQVIAL